MSFTVEQIVQLIFMPIKLSVIRNRYKHQNRIQILGKEYHPITIFHLQIK
jgi:hypothetical protein